MATLFSATSTLVGSRAPSSTQLAGVKEEQTGTVPPTGGVNVDEESGNAGSDTEPAEEEPRVPGPPKDAEKTLTPQYPDNIVGYDGPDDPECPRNWPWQKKYWFVFITSGVITCVSFGSSVFGPVSRITSAEFDVPLIVMQLGVALWILGFFSGPIFHGPMSELFGHIVVFAISICGLIIFQIPIAVAENVRTILVCRFFSGAFGSGAFAVVSGMYVEVYEPIPRGVGLGLSSIGINLGATIAPIAGYYLGYGPQSMKEQWRWTGWCTLIVTAFFGILALFFVRESSSRMILRNKAKRLRFQTGNWALHAKSEETPVELRDIVHRYLTKPIRMLVSEPILVIITIYLTLVYGTLYLSFQAFPLAFQQRGWSYQESSLPFISVVAGIFAAWGAQSVFTLTWYKTRAHQMSGPPTPEMRLPPMMAGAIILPPSLLWFGWSGHVHPASQIIALFFIGLGLMLIFVPGIAYIVDVYQFHANSAMSIHVIVRSLISCSFPLFANIMYSHLGVAWATSILAFLCIALAPAPLVFYFYGKKIRSWSSFAYES